VESNTHIANRNTTPPIARIILVFLSSVFRNWKRSLNAISDVIAFGDFLSLWSYGSERNYRG